MAGILAAPIGMVNRPLSGFLTQYTMACALGDAACLKGHTVLFATTVDVINPLAAAQAAGRMKQELKKIYPPGAIDFRRAGVCTHR